MNYVAISPLGGYSEPRREEVAKKHFLSVIRNEGRRDIPLKWGDASERQLAGKTIHLRFFLRSTNIYDVTACKYL